MKRAFCTIITADYLHYALALNESLVKHAKQADKLYVLDVQNKVNEQDLPGPLPSNMEVLHLNSLVKNNSRAREIYETYRNEERGMLRWALKPVLMAHLLEAHDLCFYCDNDLYFFNEYEFLWDELATSSVLLSPHWRTMNPFQKSALEQKNFALNFYHGYFNAGFVGSSRQGIEILEWWSNCCKQYLIYRGFQGMRDDQTFLNFISFEFNNTKIITHRGCNVSEWNEKDNPREKADTGLLIKGQKLVFAHFAASYKLAIEENRDPLMVELYLQWLQELKRFEVFSAPFQNQENTQNKKSRMVSIKQLVYRAAKKIVDRVEQGK